MKTNEEIRAELKPIIDTLFKLESFTVITTKEEWEAYREYACHDPGDDYYRASAYGDPAMSELPIVVTYRRGFSGCHDTVRFNYFTKEDLDDFAAAMIKPEDKDSA